MPPKQQMLIFDIDGVLTDPVSKQGDPAIFQCLTKKLESGALIAFNTGRSSEWVQKTILPHLQTRHLSNLFCVCEMGYVTLGFDEKQRVIEKVFEENSVPKELAGTIRDIIASSYHDSMFVDETKKVILTIEMKDGFSQKVYEELQSRLSGEIRIILKNYHPGIHIRPSSTTIAIDIKPIESGKALGIQRVVEWLKFSAIDPKDLHFTTLGDSTSDTEMNGWLNQNGYTNNFVYVGQDKLGQFEFHIDQTRDKFTKGTLEYLKQVS